MRFTTKKYKFIFLILLILTIISFNNMSVKADSGSSIGAAPISGGGGGNAGSKSGFRVYRNLGFRVTVVDENGNTLAGPVDYYNGGTYANSKNVSNFYYSSPKSRVSVISQGPTWNGPVSSKNYLQNMHMIPVGLSFSSDQGTSMSYETVKNYYTALALNKDLLLNYLRSDLSWNFDSPAYECDDLAKTFLLIEPMMTVGSGSSPQITYYGTVTELAHLAQNDARFSNIAGWSGQHSNLIFTPRNSFTMNDGRIITFNALSGVGDGGYTGSNIELSSSTLGIGSGLVWIGQVMKDNCKKCYKVYSVSVPAMCKNVGKSNIGVFFEQSQEVPCSSTDYDEDATENGRLTYTGNGCKVYCLEKAQQIFPGSVSQRASIGGYLVWPTGANVHEINYNQYSLSFFGKKKCTIEGNVSACQNVSIDQLNYKFDADITVKWQDGSSNKYKTATLKKGKVNYNKTVNDNQITVTASVRYTLNSQFNRYINIKDGSFTSTKPEKNYIDIGYGNLPISGKAKMSEKYYLTIETNKLGGNSGSTFANVASNSNIYKCYYKVTQPSSCECPADSKYPGKDLMEYLSNMTCSDAQLKYCSTPGPTPTPENCLICPAGTIREGMEMKNIELCNNPDDIKEEDLCDEIIDNKYYCPAPNEDVNITSCLKAGGTIEKCKNQLCPNNPDDLHCPNTNGVNDDSMDARLVDCVKTKVGQGVSYKEAVAICEQQVCPLKGGLNIIYRVIDLDNPFPGKEFNGNVKGFNDASKGRYPGQNWNSKDLVKSKIRNNRTVDGDSVYSKTPLYKFELTSANIKAIRKYNKTNKYDDFKLDCKLNNSAACVSNFVHNSALSGLTSGTCSGKMTSSNFYTCNN